MMHPFKMDKRYLGEPGELNQDQSGINMEAGNNMHHLNNCCHHIHKTCCNSHVSSKDAISQLLFKKNSISPDLMEADVSAIVSALAKQQSEVEDEESEDERSQISGGNYYDNRRGGGGKTKCFKRGKKAGADNGSTSSDDNNTPSCPRYHLSKDLHQLSQMFIQTTMLPRPKSTGDFKKQQEDDGKFKRSDTDIEDRNGATGTQPSGEEHHWKRGLKDKPENEPHHHGILFHPLKTLQKTFHKSDTLYPPSYSSVAYASSQTPPTSGTHAPAPSPKLPLSPAQNRNIQHHSQFPSGFLGVSSSTGTILADATTSRSPKLSPSPKYKPKQMKTDPSWDTSLSAPSKHSRERTPSHGTIPQIVTPVPPGGLPIYITPIPTNDDSPSESTQTVKRRTKYAKARAKSSGAMQ